MLATAVWSFGNAMEICSVGLEAKTIWSNIEYAGITAVPVAWLAGTLSLAGKSEWFSRRNVLLLLIIPVATQVFVWTNGYHGLMRHNVWLDESGPFAVIVKTYGPWFWIWTAYTYTLLAIGTISVMRTLVGLPGPYRAQATLVAVGVFAPWAANIVYISGLTPVGRPDITPIALVISGLAGTLAILRYRFLDIQPVAWATVIAGMDDGVVVTDYEGRVAAANPAAQALTGWSGHHAVGRHAAEVMGRWPRAVHALSAAAGRRHEPVMEVDEEDASFEFRFSPLLGSGESVIGRVIVIRDVTERKRTYEAMIRQQRALAAMEEREALAQDMHDDVCQVLGYLNLELQSAKDKLAGGQATAVVSDLENLIGVVRGALFEMRSYIRSMIGEAKSRWEFAPKLQELLRGIESRCGICTALTVSEEISDGIIGHAAALQLFRIIQEACANTVKHAGASHLWVSVEHLGSVVEVAVSDDGKGFSVVDEAAMAEEDPARASSGGLGLSIMRERAERLGGDFTLRSALGKGTEVRVCIPARPDGGGS
jgi:PAS domain S-box-containing protein